MRAAMSSDTLATALPRLPSQQHAPKISRCAIGHGSSAMHVASSRGSRDAGAAAVRETRFCVKAATPMGAGLAVTECYAVELSSRP